MTGKILSNADRQIVDSDNVRLTTTASTRRQYAAVRTAPKLITKPTATSVHAVFSHHHRQTSLCWTPEVESLAADRTYSSVPYAHQFRADRRVRLNEDRRNMATEKARSQIYKHQPPPDFSVTYTDGRTRGWFQAWTILPQSKRLCIRDNNSKNNAPYSRKCRRPIAVLLCREGRKLNSRM